ncbi:MAG: energy transducer TonB [Bacteroidota bacterium]
MKQDTIVASLRVIFEDDGRVRESEFSVYHGKKLMDASKKAIRTLMSNLPVVDIQNRKPDPIESTHVFHFKYSFDRNKGNPKLYSTPGKRSYKGGIVEEIPAFPSCKGLPQKEARACFQNMMKKHISHHFRYPEEALKRGISGIVHTTMIINKKGEFTKIRVKGDYRILELEALRILSLLPRIFPGLQNGKPVSIPYSIPITFGLTNSNPKKM